VKILIYEFFILEIVISLYVNIRTFLYMKKIIVNRVVLQALFGPGLHRCTSSYVAQIFTFLKNCTNREMARKYVLIPMWHIPCFWDQRNSAACEKHAGDVRSASNSIGILARTHTHPTFPIFSFSNPTNIQHTISTNQP
jgi:hypothetical protein